MNTVNTRRKHFFCRLLPFFVTSVPRVSSQRLLISVVLFSLFFGFKNSIAATTVGLNISTGGTLTVVGATALQGGVTVVDDTLVDFSAIQHTAATNEGLKLPVQTNNNQTPTAITGGFLAYSTTSSTLVFYDGANWQSVVTSTSIVKNNLMPAVHNSYDIGSAAKSWKDLYVAGTTYLANLDITGVTTSSGHIIPRTNTAYNIGSTQNAWQHVYASGSALLGMTLTNTIDAQSAATLQIGFTTTTAVSIGRSSATTTIRGGLSLVALAAPSVHNTVDLGAYTQAWRDVYVSGTLRAETVNAGTSLMLNNTDVALAGFNDNGNAARARVLFGGLTIPRTVATTTGQTFPLGTVFDGKNIWVSNLTADTVQKIDPFTRQVLTSVNPCTGPYDMTFDGTAVWTACQSGARVGKINATTGALETTVVVGTTPRYLTFDGTSVWVSNNGSNNVSKINPITNAVVATITLPGTATPQGIVSDGQNIWVADGTNNLVYKIDGSTNAILDTVSVGSNPTGILFDGSHIWVTNANDGTVSKIHPVANSVTATIAVGSVPRGLVFDGKLLWVANNGAGNISMINPGSNRVLATTTLGTEPSFMAYDGSNIWVTRGSNNVVNKLSSPPLGQFSGLRIDQLASGTAAYVFSQASTTPLLHLDASSTNYIGSAPNAVLRVDVGRSTTTAFDFIAFNTATSSLNTVFRVDGLGHIYSDDGITITSPADVAELTKVDGDFSRYPDGTVVAQSVEDEIATVADPLHRNFLGIATDRGVFMGSGRWGRELGKFDGKIGDFEKLKGIRRISVTGYIKIRVNDENGSIEPGDFLAISSIPGEARKARVGDTIIGMSRASFPPKENLTPVGEGTPGSRVTAHALIDPAEDQPSKTESFLPPPATQTNHGLVEAVIGNSTGMSQGSMLHNQGSPEALLSALTTSVVNQDTAGLAKILLSGTEVHITFKEPYPSAPVVTVTPETKVIGTYWLDTISPEGFTIRVDQPQASSVMFDWHALAVAEKQLFVSDGTHGKFDEEYLWGTGARQQTIVPEPTSSADLTLPVIDLSAVSSSSGTLRTEQLPEPLPETSDARGGPETYNALPFLPFTRG